MLGDKINGRHLYYWMKPEFRTISWIAMMFSAGMGIGLMFYGVTEPLTHLVKPPPGSDVYMLSRLWEWWPVLELEKGRTLGTTQIVKRFRRATMQYRSRDGKLGNFVAIAPDTYQRVGVDREH